MASRKYASDYRLESHILPDGKVESVPVYQGKYYSFVESAGRIQHLQKVILSGGFAELLFLIPMLLDNTRLGRTIYIMLPVAFVLLPLYMLIASGFYLGKVEPLMTREQKDKTDKRINSSCIALVALLCVTCAGCVLHFLLNGIMIQEVFTVLCLFGALALSIWLLPYRKLARTREVQ